MTVDSALQQKQLTLPLHISLNLQLIEKVRASSQSMGANTLKHIPPTKQKFTTEVDRWRARWLGQGCCWRQAFRWRWHQPARLPQPPARDLSERVSGYTARSQAAGYTASQCHAGSGNDLFATQYISDLGSGLFMHTHWSRSDTTARIHRACATLAIV